MVVWPPGRHLLLQQNINRHKLAHAYRQAAFKLIMCLGIPGQIVAISDPQRRLAEVEVSGVRREVNVACVCSDDAPIHQLLGEWVLVHVGFAMAKVSASEAAQTLDLLQQLGDAEADMRRWRGEA